VERAPASGATTAVAEQATEDRVAPASRVRLGGRVYYYQF